MRDAVVGSTALASDGPIRAGQRTFSPAQLTGVLHQTGALASDRSVTTVNAEPLGVGESMMSELTRLHLTYDGPAANDSPRTIVVKRACPDEYRRSIVDRFGFYRRRSSSSTGSRRQSRSARPAATRRSPMTSRAS